MSGKLQRHGAAAALVLVALALSAQANLLRDPRLRPGAPPGAPARGPDDGRIMSRIVRARAAGVDTTTTAAAATALLQETEGENPNDLYYCVHALNLPASGERGVDFCPQVDYHVAVPVEDWTRYEGWWPTPSDPSDPNSPSYFYNSDGTQWHRPETATFTKMTNRARDITSKLTSAGMGCERAVRAAACAAVFRRCEPDLARRPNNYDSSVFAVKELVPVCRSFCTSLHTPHSDGMIQKAECIMEREDDSFAGSDPLTIEAASLINEPTCRNPQLSDTHCCCSHAWGVTTSFGSARDSSQALNFITDSMGVRVNLMLPHIGQRKTISVVKEDRVVTALLDSPITHAGDPVFDPETDGWSAIDYSQVAVDGGTMVAILGTGRASMYESCDVINAEEDACADELVRKQAAWDRNKNPGGYCVMEKPLKMISKRREGLVGLSPYCQKRVKHFEDMFGYLTRRDGRYVTTLTENICEGSLQRFKQLPTPLMKARCSGRELVSGPEDTVVIYISSHGGEDGSLQVQSDTDGSQQWQTASIRATILALARRHRFSQLYLVVDACFSGSLFIDWPELPANVFVLTSSLDKFVSYMSAVDDNSGYVDSDIGGSSITWNWIVDTQHRLYLNKLNGESTVEAQCMWAEDILRQTVKSKNMARTSGALPRCFGVSREKPHFEHPLTNFFRQTVAIEGAREDPTVKPYGMRRVVTPLETYQSAAGDADQVLKEVAGSAEAKQAADKLSAERDQYLDRIMTILELDRATVPWKPDPASPTLDVDFGVALAARYLLLPATDGVDGCSGVLVNGDDIDTRIARFGTDHGALRAVVPEDIRFALVRHALGGPERSVRAQVKKLFVSKEGLSRTGIEQGLRDIIEGFSSKWFYEDGQAGFSIRRPEGELVNGRVMLDFLIHYIAYSVSVPNTVSKSARPTMSPLNSQFCKAGTMRGVDSSKQLMALMAGVFASVASACAGVPPPPGGNFGPGLALQISDAEYATLDERVPVSLPATPAGDALGGLTILYEHFFCSAECTKRPNLKASCTKWFGEADDSL